MISGYFLEAVRSYPSEAIAIVVSKLIEELRAADAALILFEVHKLQHHKWFEVRDKLLRRNQSFLLASLTITVLFASKQNDPSGFYSVIPGLKDLMESTKGPRPEIETDESHFDAEKARIEFWEKFCKEHPEEMECKCYEV